MEGIQLLHKPGLSIWWTRSHLNSWRAVPSIIIPMNCRSQVRTRIICTWQRARDKLKITPLNKMRKLLPFFIALVVTLSCEKTTVNGVDLIGKWHLLTGCDSCAVFEFDFPAIKKY